ncbi:hypothetical protein SAMN05216583_1702, partial [Selenomonas sp. KH1T6]
AKQGAANLTAGNDLVAKDVTAGTDVVLGAGNQVKANALTAGKDVTATGADVKTTGAVIAKNGEVSMEATAGDVTAEGEIKAAKAVTLEASNDVTTKTVTVHKEEMPLFAASAMLRTGVPVDNSGVANLKAGHNVTTEGVTADKDVIADAGNDVKATGKVEAGNDVKMKAGNDISTAAVTANNDVTMDATHDIKATGKVEAGNDVNLQAKNDISTVAVTANHDVTMDATNDITAADLVEAVNNVKLNAGHDISTADVTANQKVRMDAGNDVTINGYISGLAQNAEDAVDIRAQERFLNKLDAAGKDSSAAIKVGEESHWKVYSNSPYADDFGGGVNENGLNRSEKDLDSGNYAVWGWDGTSTTSEVGNRYIFKNPRPTLTIKANDATKAANEDWTGKNTGYTMTNSLTGQFMTAFLDGDDEKLASRVGYKQVGTYSNGFKPNSYKVGVYEGDITLTNTGDAAPSGFNLVLLPGTLTVVAPTPGPTPGPNPPTPGTSVTPGNPTGPVVPTITTSVPTTTPENPQANNPLNPGEKPQLDALTTSNLAGTASITQGQNAQGPGVDRVLGLQSAELPFFNEKLGQVKLYGTYDVTVDPDSVKMEPTAKVLPEPDQPKNQYREYDKELTTADGSGMFRLTYNGSTLDIYPIDKAAKALLKAGDGAKNVEVESQALLAAFKSMGITLDNLDGVYTHFEEKR